MADQSTEDKVKNIYGGPVITVTPHRAVIEELEFMLEAARSGEIVGIAGAVMHGDTSTSTRLVGMSNRSLLGALVEVQHRLVERD